MARVGVCRDFALLHCSFLRHVGVPARLRSGFADYVGSDGFHGDHVVTEYWDAERGWLLADPQMADPMVVDTFGIDFDPMNETLMWDIWGPGPGSDEGLTDAIRELYDHASRVARDDVAFDTARKLFARSDGLRTPRTVLSLAPFNGPREVTLR
ncbi:transglutaminase-like domain-containing protein [Streptomyces sp. NPDC052051]|uniref:transglutaminase-like domain-containing protein n=1 Tax=Streptomyces sp. NPDC052051 TaxID=3154649 RepID=UPI0034282106